MAQRVAEALAWGVGHLGRRDALRRVFVRLAERRLRAQERLPPSALRHPPGVQADKVALALALLHLLDRALAEQRLSGAALEGLVGRLLHDVLGRRTAQDAKARFERRNGCRPPEFLTLSPGQACNLRCAGCYANAGPTPRRLDWDTLERIVREAHDLWGLRFFVLSGGEPFAWRDGGRGILDLAERHRDCYFLSYTNGTLIRDDVVARLAELGNLTPGLSIEGLRERTDARRGAGVFDQVVAAAERLRSAGVLFGLSLTATRDNCAEILGDEVLELFFQRLGAMYAWVFHYMPIGRAPSLELMMTPEQRLALHARVWELVRERRLFVADFWNSASVTNGCVAGGRAGGYFYIDWSGACCPCVFVPYAPVDIRDVYARGGTLDDVWSQPFFAAFRAWQRAYGYRQGGERAPAECGNWLRPCLIRDHHAAFQRLVEEHRPRPTDQAAFDALHDDAYHAGLDAFDERLAELSDPLWRENYLAPSKSGPRST
jgi:MoaA/NifB/PqqE/SkfB family radical SAM enzyme